MINLLSVLFSHITCPRKFKYVHLKNINRNRLIQRFRSFEFLYLIGNKIQNITIKDLQKYCNKLLQ